MFDGGKITKWKQGEYEFSIRMMNPFRAMKVLGDLQKLIIPAIGGAAAGLNDSSENAEVVSAIGGALANIAENVDGDKLQLACNLPLDPDAAEYNDGKTPHVNMGHKKVYEEVPFQFKVNSKLALKRALALIEQVKAL